MPVNVTRSPRLDPASVGLALDRVLWVRLDDDHRSAVVAGIRRRRPAFVRVASATADALEARGVPVVGRGRDLA